MGNDMFNDEQLAYMKTRAIHCDPAFAPAPALPEAVAEAAERLIEALRDPRHGYPIREHQAEVQSLVRHRTDALLSALDAARSPR